MVFLTHLCTFDVVSDAPQTDEQVTYTYKGYISYSEQEHLHLARYLEISNVANKRTTFNNQISHKAIINSYGFSLCYSLKFFRIESLRLEKAFVVIESNHKPNSAKSHLTIEI